MSRFAGSAIAQGPSVGRIDRWPEWKPTGSVQPRWLLLSGASNPPVDIVISKRRTRDTGDESGEFLAGITHDLVNMEEAVGTKLSNTVKDLYLTKSAALGHIRRLFDECKCKGTQPLLYYTGHGEVGTGNWCFDDGKIGIQEIFDMMPGGMYYPMIFSDTCYSGHWANFCLRRGIPGFHCLAACPEYSMAVDSKCGGDLTLFMTGKKERPRTEPLYSGGNLHDFPITSGFDLIDYNDFIESYTLNSRRVVISQSMHNECFCACFATLKQYTYKPRPALTWDIKENYDTFIAFVTQWRTSMRIYSLACDERFGFGVFLMGSYGTRQAIVTDTSEIQKFWDDGFQVTACAARGSTFYIIMTKDTKEYTGKLQTWFTRWSWSEVETEIQNGDQTGKAVTGICYSTGLEQYFVVMTEKSGGQCYAWHTNNTKYGYTKTENWVNAKSEAGFYPTIIFKDPTDDKVLFVMTKDESFLDFTYRINYQMKSELNWR